MELSKDELEQIIAYLTRRVEEYYIYLESERLQIRDQKFLHQLVFEKHFKGNKEYYTIRKEISSLLRYIDLSNLSFTSVCLNGSVSFADLSGTNANVNPQLVHELDMRNGIFPLDFTGKSFRDVKIASSDFSGSTGITLKTSELFADLSNGIYPIELIIDNEPSFVDCSHSDFTGSSANIDEFLQKIYGKDEDIKNGTTTIYEKHGIKTELSTLYGLDYEYRRALLMKNASLPISNNIKLAKIMIDNSFKNILKRNETEKQEKAIG